MDKTTIGERNIKPATDRNESRDTTEQLIWLAASGFDVAFSDCLNMMCGAVEYSQRVKGKFRLIMSQLDRKARTVLEWKAVRETGRNQGSLCGIMLSSMTLHQQTYVDKIQLCILITII